MRAVIEALEGLSDKRLARGVLWDERKGCGCLIGAIAPREVRETCGTTLVVGTGNPRCLFASAAAREWAQGFGLTAEEVDYLQRLNDAVKDVTEEQRYHEVLRQLKKEEVG